MRAVLQRVTRASVTVGGEVVGRIGPGLAILLGVAPGDGPAEVRKLAEKSAQLRVFPDPAGKMNLSLLDVKGAALVVSQFTLYADCSAGRRPSFVGAARPETAAPLVDAYAAALGGLGVATVERGVFGADMSVEIVNDGPVTIWLDTDAI